MTPTSSVQSTTPAATTGSASNVTDTEEAAANLTSDFETFLQLLTTQMKNQDPSKPLDSNEFIAQLASFSAVEQQINTNTKLDSLLNALNTSSTANLGQWIGTEVLSAAPANFSGVPIPVEYTQPSTATSGMLLVHDAAGTLVDRVPVQPGSSSMMWDGKALDGTPMPHGAYRFELESFNGNDSLGKQPAETFSTVVEARMEPEGMTVVFADGSKLSVDAIAAVRGSQSVSATGT